MKKSILGLLLLVSIVHADFSRDTTTKVVTDNKTHLEWKDDEIGSKINWQEAITYCENLTFASHDDWRLPNRKELETIIDFSVYNPAIDSNFQNTNSINSESYWSSSTSARFTSYSLSIRFHHGHLIPTKKSGNGYVRCVRAGQ